MNDSEERPPAEEHTAEVILLNRMRKDEFDRRWQDICRTYGTSKRTAAARYEQVMGGLFDETGWTQEEIAEEAKLNQSTVARLLTFGAFLAFLTTMPGGINAGYTTLRIPLTEFRFRGFWTTTKEFSGNERRRYVETWKLIVADDQNQAAGGRKRPRDFAALRVDLGKAFGDNRWHPEERMCDRLEADAKTLADAIESGNKFRLKDFPFQVEQKQVGPQRHYRLLKLDRTLSLHKVLEELTPIKAVLDQQARQSSVKVSMMAIARVAQRLTMLMQKWEESSPVLETPGSNADEQE